MLKSKLKKARRRNIKQAQLACQKKISEKSPEEISQSASSNASERLSKSGPDKSKVKTFTSEEVSRMREGSLDRSSFPSSLYASTDEDEVPQRVSQSQVENTPSQYVRINGPANKDNRQLNMNDNEMMKKIVSDEEDEMMKEISDEEGKLMKGIINDEEAPNIEDDKIIENEIAEPNTFHRTDKSRNFLPNPLQEDTKYIICDLKLLEGLLNSCDMVHDDCGHNRYNLQYILEKYDRTNRKISVPENIRGKSVDGEDLSFEISAGIGNTRGTRFLNNPDLPCNSRSTYDNHKILMKAMHLKVEKMKVKAAQVIREYYMGKESESEKCLDITVSYVCSWGERGDDSDIGIGFVVDAETSIILDFGIRSKFCVICASLKHLEDTGLLVGNELQEKREEHKSDCDMNMDPSKPSSSMEADIAVELFSRSLNNKLRYTKLVSYEDSSTYKKLLEANPYGEKFPIKEIYSLKHIQKKIYKEIESANELHNLGIGEGNLNKDIATIFSKIYCLTVREFKNDCAKLRENIYAFLFHHAATDDNPIHQFCPKGVKSWCKFRRDLSLHKTVDKDWHKKKSNRKYCLNKEAAKVLYSILIPYLYDEVIEKMSEKTQNVNESIHSKVWSICNKTPLYTKSSVEYICGDVFLRHNCEVD